MVSVARTKRLAGMSRRDILAMQSKDPTKVETTSLSYDDMWVDWGLGEDLCLGREEMIAKTELWLPREPAEEASPYWTRLNRSFLFNGYRDTLERLSSKPFAKEVGIQNEENIPERLGTIAGNVDLQGTDLTAFSKKLLFDAMKYGHTMVYVDMPDVPENRTDQPLSLLEELEGDVRPYWIHVSPPNLIGWRSHFVNGREILTQIRIKEERSVPDPGGPFGDVTLEVIKVITAPSGDFPGTIQEWHKGQDNDFIPQPEIRTFTYPGIPLFWLPLNATGKGMLRSTPPLQPLAELNLEHWQKSSDLSNILRFVSIAMVLLTGMGNTTGSDAEATGGPSTTTWGVNSILRGEMGADGKYIEHSGAGIESLFRAVHQVEQRMEMLGLQPLLAKQQDVTATAQRKDDQKVTSTIQGWIRKLEIFIYQLYQASAVWIDETAPFAREVPKDSAITFDVYNDFGIRVATRDDGDILLNTWKEGGISDETLISEYKKRGIVGEEVVVSEEIARIKAREAEKNTAALALAQASKPEPTQEETTDAEADDTQEAVAA